MNIHEIASQLSACQLEKAQKKLVGITYTTHKYVTIQGHAVNLTEEHEFKKSSLLRICWFANGLVGEISQQKQKTLKSDVNAIRKFIATLIQKVNDKRNNDCISSIVRFVTCLYAKYTLKKLSTLESQLPATESLSPQLQNFLLLVPKAENQTMPEMNHSIASHILGDNSVKNMKLNGVPLEGADSTVMSRYYTGLIKEIEQKEHLLTDAQKEEVFKRLNQIYEASALGHVLEKSNEKWEQKAQLFSEWMRYKISQMAVGETLMIPAGWGTKTISGHTMLFEIKRYNEFNYSFTVNNTGGGLAQFHPSITKKGRKRAYLQSLTLSNLSLNDLTKPEIWKSHYDFRHDTCAKDNFSGFTAQQVYQWLNSIKPDFLYKATRETCEHAKPEDFELPQKAGRCSAAAINLMLKKALGDAYSPLKQSILFHTVHKYAAFAEEEQKVSGDLDPAVVQVQTYKQLERYTKRVLRNLAGAVKKIKKLPDSNKKTQLLKKNEQRQETLGKLQESTRKHKQESEEERRVRSSLQLSPPQPITDSGMHFELPNPAAAVIAEEEPSAIADVSDEEEVKESSECDDDEEQWLAIDLPKCAQNLRTFITDRSDLLAFSWPKEIKGHEVVEFLSSWMRSYSRVQPSGKRYGDLTIEYLHQLIDKIPSVNDPIWDSIPIQDLNNCIECLGYLSTRLRRSHKSSRSSDAYYETGTCIYGMEKILAISLCLSQRNPDALISNHKIDVSNLSHTKIVCEEGEQHKTVWVPRNGLYFTENPEADRDKCATWEYLSQVGSTSSKDQHRLFSYPEVVAKSLQNVCTLFSITPQLMHNLELNRHSSQQNGPPIDEEITLIYSYIKSHRNVWVRIEESLRRQLSVAWKDNNTQQIQDWKETHDEEEEYPLPAHITGSLPAQLILAEALTDLTGQYLPQHYCAIKQQVIHNMQMSYEGDCFVPSIQAIIRDFAEQGHLHEVRIYYTSSTRGLYTPPEDGKELYETTDCPEFIKHVLKNSAPKTDEVLKGQISTAELEKQVLFLRTREDLSQQIVKTIHYFSQNINLLKEKKYRFVLKSLLFSPGLLYTAKINNLSPKDKQLLAKQLAKFCQDGYTYFNEQSHPEGIRYFLRLSQTLHDTCVILLQDQPKLMDEVHFPDALKELHTQLKKANGYTAELADEIMALFGRGCHVTVENLPILLHAIWQEKDRNSWDGERSDRLRREISKGREALISFCNTLIGTPALDKAMSTALSEYLDQPVAGKWEHSDLKIYKKEGKISFASTIAGIKYSFQLGEGPLFINGTKHYDHIPLSIDMSYGLCLSSIQAKKIYAEVLESGQASCTFEDECGNKYKMERASKNSKIFIYREIEGTWHILCKRLGVFTQVFNCSVPWYNPQTGKVIFTDKTKSDTQVYHFDPRSGILKGLTDSKHAGLIGLETAQEFAFLKKLDSDMEVWGTERGATRIDLPSFGVQFAIDPDGHIKGTGELEGFFIPKDQYVEDLICLSRYLVLEKEQTEEERRDQTPIEKRVLIPFCETLTCEFELASPIKIDETTSEHFNSSTAQFCSYTFSTKSPELRSVHLRDQIYLALILMNKDPQKAYQILQHVDKLDSYDKEELFQLIKIIQMDYKDPISIATRLSVALKINDNLTNYDYHPKIVVSGVRGYNLKRNFKRN